MPLSLKRIGRRPRRGQTLVEFALVLPLFLLILLLALDFGRIFLGWVSLSNAARIGANYAAQNSTAWSTGDTAHQDEYQTPHRR